jgi:hypothetical protein
LYELMTGSVLFEEEVGMQILCCCSKCKHASPPFPQYLLCCLQLAW